MAGNSHHNDLLDWCRDEPGVTVTNTARNHKRVTVVARVGTDSDGAPFRSGITVTSGTPSDRRATLNFRAELRRMLRAAGWTEDELP